MSAARNASAVYWFHDAERFPLARNGSFSGTERFGRNCFLAQFCHGTDSVQRYCFDLHQLTSWKGTVHISWPSLFLTRDGREFMAQSWHGTERILSARIFLVTERNRVAWFIPDLELYTCIVHTVYCIHMCIFIIYIYMYTVYIYTYIYIWSI